MANDLTRRGGVIVPEPSSKEISEHIGSRPAMSPKCAANGCFLANIDVREKMRQAVAGQLGRNFEQSASMCYSLCRSIKEGECECANRGKMPCTSMVGAIEFMCTVLVPAALAANGITDADLRMYR